MSKILTLFPSIALLTTLLATGHTVHAQGENPSDPEPVAGSVVCAPGVYPSNVDECVPLGPAEQITQAAENGIPYPVAPLPAYAPPIELTYVPYRYFKVTENGGPLYASLGDALANNSYQSLAPGFLYVSYIDSSDGFYQLRSGNWIAAEGARAAIPTFQGLLFSSTPTHSFGWVLGESNSLTAPDYNAPPTGNVWYRYNVVEIYEIRPIDGVEWLMIGPDEWLTQAQVARVDPRTAPPDGIPSSRWIDVNLNEQTLAVYQDNQLVFATIISSGVDPYWTRPGIFQIYEIKDVETMSGSTEVDRSDYYYLEDVPWTMYFDEKRALHGEYWHVGLGYARSHGCVNLSVGDAHWLYDWALMGDYVYVYDPSGKTPTDSSLYGNGAP